MVPHGGIVGRRAGSLVPIRQVLGLCRGFACGVTVDARTLPTTEPAFGGGPMNDVEKVETARAAREARDTVGQRKPSSTAEGIDVAMRKHLAAEEYYARRHGRQARADGSEEEPDR